MAINNLVNYCFLYLPTLSWNCSVSLILRFSIHGKILLYPFKLNTGADESTLAHPQYTISSHLLMYNVKLMFFFPILQYIITAGQSYQVAIAKCLCDFCQSMPIPIIDQFVQLKSPTCIHVFFRSCLKKKVFKIPETASCGCAHDSVTTIFKGSSSFMVRKYLNTVQ